MTAVRTVPAMVARGMVRAGSMTRAAGTVADSRPSIANKAMVEAVTMSRPYPWVTGTWLAAPGDAGPLAGWEMADQIAGGLPVLLRNGFKHPREDLALRAFLGQPLILYGHQHDLADGLDGLRAAAAQINALGPVRWDSLTGIARAGFQTRRDGERLHVRLH